MISTELERARQNSAARKVLLGMAEKEIREYSVTRAIQALAAQVQSGVKARSVAPLEFEISDALQTDLGKQAQMPNSILLPTDLLMQRDLTTSNASAGGYLVGQSMGPVVDALRARSVVARLGATVLSGLSGDVPLPKISTGATGAWLSSEATPSTESTPTTGQIVLKPKLISGFVELSRKLLTQSNADIVVRRDLTNMVAASIDAAALNGSGAAGEPQGLLQTSGVNSISGTSLAWGGVLDFVVNAGVANLDVSGFATTPAIYKLLASREKSAGSGMIIADGEIDRRPVFHSTGVPSATLIAGPWPELWIGEWGSVEIGVDPFTRFKEQVVGVRILMAVDTAVRHPAAFSKASSIT